MPIFQALLASWLLSALWCQAQSLSVYSEFQRVNPFGEVVSVDRSPSRREILSPAVARNAHASFHLAATIPQGVPSFLYIQQNPERLDVTLYREVFSRTEAGWIPDALEKIKVPHFLILPQQDAPIPKQNTIVFWMDLWVPAETPVARLRLEAVLKSGDRWIVYPMEVRVMNTVAPAVRWSPGPVANVTARSDASLYGPMRRFLCGFAERGAGSGLTVRQLIRRNVLEDLALAEALGVKDEVLRRLGPAWCDSTRFPAALSPEWYLPLRNFLVQRTNVEKNQSTSGGAGDGRRGSSQ